MQVNSYMLNQLHKHVRPGQESLMMNCSKNQGPLFVYRLSYLMHWIIFYNPRWYTFRIWDLNLFLKAIQFHSIMIRLARVNDHHSDAYPFSNLQVKKIFKITIYTLKCPQNLNLENLHHKTI